MDNLVLHTTYEITEDTFNSKPLKVTPPIIWLRTQTKPGDKLGLFEHPETHELIIKQIPQPKDVS